MGTLEEISLRDIVLGAGRSLAFVVPHTVQQMEALGRNGREEVRIRVHAVLSHVTGLSPGTLRLERTRQGKPYLAAGGAVSFNLSHARSHSLIALSLGGHIGCDVEDRFRDDDDVDELGAVVLHPVEQQEMRRLAAPQRQEAFKRYWVRKEAVLKAAGSGFLKDPRAVIVGLDRAQPTWDGPDGPAMNIHERQLGPDCFAAVASADAACSWHLLQS
jgi:phosphopantetheinyl transferase